MARTTGWFDDDVLQELARRYSGFRTRPISYATVRDFCDSFDHMRLLATANGDLKDAQRPWMLKALLGRLRPGARVLEIGAGEPTVADVLQRLGHEVWIVDPYDGTGNGPREYEIFRRECPEIRFVRDHLREDTPGVPARAFDAVYSISVLEHVPPAAIDGVIAAARRAVRPDGWHVHAIDHVHKGAGDAAHLANLRRFVTGYGASTEELDRELSALSADTETYYLSAESHNRWRGPTPYDAFPMRVCVSVQLCLPASGP
jgi:SAM-dependent methyltransferase